MFDMEWHLSPIYSHFLPTCSTWLPLSSAIRSHLQQNFPICFGKSSVFLSSWPCAWKGAIFTACPILSANIWAGSHCVFPQLSRAAQPVGNWQGTIHINRWVPAGDQLCYLTLSHMQFFCLQWMSHWESMSKKKGLITVKQRCHVCNLHTIGFPSNKWNNKNDPKRHLLSTFWVLCRNIYLLMLYVNLLHFWGIYDVA